MKQNTYTPIQQVNDVQPIRATCFHPSGEAYVVGTNSKALKICKYPNPSRRHELIESGSIEEPEVSFTCLRVHCASVYCAAFNSAGNLLATGSNDQIVHIIKYNSARHAPVGKEFKLSMHNGTIRAVRFLHDVIPEADNSKLLSAGAGDFGVYLTDCEPMKPVRAFKGHEATVMTLDSCKDSPDLFVSGSLDGTIRLWDVRSRAAISTIVGKQEQQQSRQQKPLPRTPPVTADGDTSFDFSNRTRILSAANPADGDGPDDETRNQENQRPAATGMRVPRRLPPPPPVESAQLAPPSDSNSTQPSGVPVGSVRLEPSGRLLVSGHQDGSCMLYDIRAAKIIQLFQAHADEIRSLDFSPKSYYLLSASYDRKVKLTDLQGNLTQPLPCVEVAELDDKVVQVAWHPQDYNFVSTCAEGSATLWTVADFDNWRDSLVMETSVVI